VSALKKEITIIMPSNSCGVCGDKPLIVRVKLESELQKII